MEQKELFHITCWNSLAVYELFLHKSNNYFDILSISFNSIGAVRVGIYCLPRDLFWVGYGIKSFETLE